MPNEASMIIKAIDNATAPLREVGKSIDGLKTQANGLGDALKTGLLAVGMRELLLKGEEAQGALARLAINVKNTGTDFESVKPQIEALTEAMSEQSGIARDNLTESLAKLTLKTGDVKVAMGGLGIAMNIAAAAHLDIESATQLYSNALEGNIKRLEKAVLGSNNLSKAGKSNAEIMKVIEERTKGASEALGNTKPVEKLTNILSEAAETIASYLLPAVNKLAQIITWIGPDTIALAAGLAAVVAVAIKIPAILSLINALMAANPIGLIILAVGALVIAFKLLWDHFAGFRAFWETAWVAIKATCMAVITPIIEYVKSLGVIFQNLITALEHPFNVAGWKTAIKNVEEQLSKSFDTTVTAFKEIGTKTGKAWAENYEKEQKKQLAKKLVVTGPPPVPEAKSDETENKKREEEYLKLNEIKLKADTDYYAAKGDEAKAAIEKENNEYKLQQEKINSLTLTSTAARNIALEVLKKSHDAKMDKLEDDNRKKTAMLEAAKAAQFGNKKKAELIALDAQYKEDQIKYAGNEQQLLLLKQTYADKRDEIEALSHTNQVALFQGTVAAFQNAIAGTLAAVFEQNKSFAAAMKDVFKSFISSMISMLTQLIAKMIVVAALKALITGGVASVSGIVASMLKGLGETIPGYATKPGEARKITGPYPGAAVPIMAHVGETIGTPSQSSGPVYNFYGDNFGWEGTTEMIRKNLYKHNVRTGLPVMAT